MLADSELWINIPKWHIGGNYWPGAPQFESANLISMTNARYDIRYWMTSVECLHLLTCWSCSSSPGLRNFDINTVLNNEILILVESAYKLLFLLKVESYHILRIYKFFPKCKRQLKLRNCKVFTQQFEYQWPLKLLSVKNFVKKPHIRCHLWILYCVNHSNVVWNESINVKIEEPYSPVTALHLRPNISHILLFSSLLDIPMMYYRLLRTALEDFFSPQPSTT